MKYCKYCNIKYNTPLEHCMFCNNELMNTPGEGIDVNDLVYHYPQFEKKKNVRRFLLRLFAFIGFITILSCIYLDVTNQSNPVFSWSRYVISSIVYALFLFSILTSNKKSIQKVTFSSYLTLLLLLYLGSLGKSSIWSVDFVLPFGLIAINITNLFFLVIKKKRHHDYAIYNMIASLIGLLPILFVLYGNLAYTWPSVVCFLYSLTTFLGIVFFTPHATKEEIKRRLHL